MRPRSATLGIAATVATLVGGFSCRQVLGLTDEPPMDLPPTSTACGLPWGTSTCASCVNANCCDAASACAADVACAAYFQCVGACQIGDWQCRAQCGLDYPFGGAKGFASLTMCTTAQCESECGLTCGGLGALNVPPMAAGACQACYEKDSNTCASTSACAASADCIGWLQCVSSCVTPDCRTACGDRFGLADAGVAGTASLMVPPPELSTIGTIGGPGTCATSCGIGSNWSCVGHVAWPTPTLAGTTLETQVIDSTSGQPVSGVEVSICRFGDPTCSSPLGGPVRSDPNGFVVLPVLPAQVTINTVGAESFAQLTSAATFPTLIFLGYPVSEPVAPIGHPYVFATPLSDAPANWDAANGGLIVGQAFDCDGVAAADVTLAIDSTNKDVVSFYYQGTTPSTALSATTTDGAPYGGGFVNVPPGVVTITATPKAIGMPSSKAHVLVQAGTITDVFMFPTPL